jgi:acetylornithine/N-succinyldiaminopimelate aminotransferase
VRSRTPVSKDAGLLLLLNAPRPNLLRFMPALNVTAEEIDLMLSELDKLIAQGRKA